jgi:hypothetical protein
MPMDVLFDDALEVERVLPELGKTPFELLNDKQEENMGTIETTVEKQVLMLNESLINLLNKQLDLQFKPSATLGGSTSSNDCQICHVEDHLANECLRYAIANQNVRDVEVYIRLKIMV